MSSQALGPDHSVRPAREPDLGAIGAVHVRSWTGPYAQALPTALVDRLSADLLADAWRSAVVSPPSPAHRVLVALGDGIVAGFVAAAPVHGRDGALDEESVDTPAPERAATVEVVALEVDPLHQRRGHGSRLLAAVVDTCRADGTDQLHAWVHVDDAARTAFLRGAGFDTDGARRRRALAGADPDDLSAVWPEVRLVAWLAEA